MNVVKVLLEIYYWLERNGSKDLPDVDTFPLQGHEIFLHASQWWMKQSKKKKKKNRSSFEWSAAVESDTSKI